MSNLRNRIKKLEILTAPNDPPQFDVQLVGEITDEMRQAQREAHARGERYYIVEAPEADHEQA